MAEEKVNNKIYNLYIGSHISSVYESVACHARDMTVKQKCITMLYLLFKFLKFIHPVQFCTYDFKYIIVFQVQLCFPEEGLVYDYHLDDAGISRFDDEEDEKGRKVRKQFSLLLWCVYM